MFAAEQPRLSIGMTDQFKITAARPPANMEDSLLQVQEITYA